MLINFIGVYNAGNNVTLRYVVSQRTNEPIIITCRRLDDLDTIANTYTTLEEQVYSIPQADFIEYVDYVFQIQCNGIVSEYKTLKTRRNTFTPTGVTAIGISSTAILAQCDASDISVGYNFSIYTRSGNTYTPVTGIDTISVDTPCAQFDGLTQDTTYYVAVKANNDDTGSVPEYVEAKTLKKLSVEDLPEQAFQNFNISAQRDSNNNTVLFGWSNTIPGQPAVSSEVGNLKPNTAYAASMYAQNATNGALSSQRSNTVNVATTNRIALNQPNITHVLTNDNFLSFTIAEPEQPYDVNISVVYEIMLSSSNETTQDGNLKTAVKLAYSTAGTFKYTDEWSDAVLLSAHTYYYQFRTKVTTASKRYDDSAWSGIQGFTTKNITQRPSDIFVTPAGQQSRNICLYFQGSPINNTVEVSMTPDFTSIIACYHNILSGSILYDFESETVYYIRVKDISVDEIIGDSGWANYEYGHGNVIFVKQESDTDVDTLRSAVQYVNKQREDGYYEPYLIAFSHLLQRKAIYVNFQINITGGVTISAANIAEVELKTADLIYTRFFNIKNDSGAVILENLKFTGGNCISYKDILGGGAIYACNKSPLQLSHCSFVSNGTGTYNDRQSILLETSLWSAKGYEGGAVRVDSYGPVTFNSCLFEDNYSEFSGGAVSIIGHSNISSVVFNNCSFNDNKARVMGGGLSVKTETGGISTLDCEISSSDFSSNIAENAIPNISGNIIPTYGGAICSTERSTLAIHGTLSLLDGENTSTSVISDNSATHGAGIYSAISQFTDVRNKEHPVKLDGIIVKENNGNGLELNRFQEKPLNEENISDYDSFVEVQKTAYSLIESCFFSGNTQAGIYFTNNRTWSGTNISIETDDNLFGSSSGSSSSSETISE